LHLVGAGFASLSVPVSKFRSAMIPGSRESIRRQRLRILGLEISANTIAWLLVATLLVVLSLNATGIINLRIGSIMGGQSAQVSGPLTPYVDAAEKLKDADQSQPLHVELEGQYPGPLQDTIIQRWRDPVDGTICYIYLPVAVAHSAGPQGLVQYGAAHIGSISCFPSSAPQNRH
jgi:hypothetical protein